MYEQTGRKPTALVEQPDLDSIDSWYFNAYTFLESDRPPPYMSVPQIPLTAFREYAKDFGTIEDDLYTFCEIMTKIDSAYLSYINRPKPKKGAVR